MLRFLDKEKLFVRTHKASHMDELWILYLLKRLGIKFKVKLIPSNTVVDEGKEESVLYVGVGDGPYGHHGPETCSLKNFVDDLRKNGVSIPGIEDDVLDKIVEIVFRKDTTGHLFRGPPHPGLNILSIPSWLKGQWIENRGFKEVFQKVCCFFDLIVDFVRLKKARDFQKINLGLSLAEFLLEYIGKVMRLKINSSPESLKEMLSLFDEGLEKTTQYFVNGINRKIVRSVEEAFALPGLVYVALLQKKKELARQIAFEFFEASYGKYQEAEDDFKKSGKKVATSLGIAVFFCSNSPMADSVARQYGKIVVIRRNSGHVQIFSSVDLSSLAARIRRKEALLRNISINGVNLAQTGTIPGIPWFLHKSKKLLLNGSLTSDEPPSVLTDEMILKLLQNL